MRKSVLAICGGGNAGHALAVAASQNFDGEIHWLVRTEEKAELLRNSMLAQPLQSSGAIQGVADKVRVISSDPEDVIPDADIVILAVPAFAHAPVLARVAPHLKSSVLLGAIPTRGGFEFDVSRFVGGIEPNGERVIFGLQTLPWSTRVQEVGKSVHFGAIKAKVLMATSPDHHAPQLAALLSRILGTEIVPAAGFLNMTLGNPGQIVHPGLMYGLFSKWAGETYREETIPRLYADATDEIGHFVASLSSNVVRVARALETASQGRFDLSGVLHVHDWLRISYPTQTADLSSVATCFRTGPIQVRKAPATEISPGTFVPNFHYRYLSEDVPYGLVVTKAIAELAGVATPAVDDVVLWAEARMNAQYIVAGRVAGADAESLPLPQNYGIATLEQLIAAYAGEGSSTALAAAS